MSLRKRPATVGYPISLLEINLIERPTRSIPMIGRPPKITEPSYFKREVRNPYVFTSIERLRLPIYFEPTTFQDTHPKRLPNEFVR